MAPTPPQKDRTHMTAHTAARLILASGLTIAALALGGCDWVKGATSGDTEMKNVEIQPGTASDEMITLDSANGDGTAIDPSTATGPVVNHPAEPGDGGEGPSSGGGSSSSSSSSTSSSATPGFSSGSGSSANSDGGTASSGSNSGGSNSGGDTVIRPPSGGAESTTPPREPTKARPPEPAKK